MQIDNLIKMANQIGHFFHSFPDQEQAQKDIAQHLTRFWALSMRRQIALHVLTNNGAGLDNNVCEAIRKYLGNDQMITLTQS